MARSAAQIIEVRSATGSDTNGGGFKAGATGTDWSQQASPQYSATDGVTAGTTTITSATANFGVDVVGNLAYIAGGTGAVVADWYEITARNSSTSITVDRSTGLTAGTGVTVKIGGAFATLGVAVAVGNVAGNTIYAKGTFTPTGGTITLVTGVAYIGYGTTRSDGNRAIIDASGMTAAANCLTYGGSLVVRNFEVQNAKAKAFFGSFGTAQNCVATNAATDGFSNIGTVYGCSATGCVTGFKDCGARLCYAATCTTGFSVTSNGNVAFSGCVARACGTGFSMFAGASGTVSQCVAYGSTGDGFVATQFNPSGFDACVAYGNGGYGYNWWATSARQHGYIRNCYAGSNTSGASNNPDTTLDAAITNLTAQPFVDPTTTFDFTPNTTSGGGALLRAGAQIVIPGTVGTNYSDAGAIQHQDAGGTTTNAFWIEG